MSLSHIQDNLRHLRLYRIHERLETVLEEAAKNNVSYTDFLDEILSQEVASKQVKADLIREPENKESQHGQEGKYSVTIESAGVGEGHSLQ